MGQGSYNLTLNNRNCWLNMTKIENLEQCGFGFGLAKYHVQKLSWPKVNFKKDFRNIFDFTLSLFQPISKRWVNIKLKVIRVTFTSYCLLYSIVHYYKHLNKTFWDHDDSHHRKNLGSPMPKQNDDLCLQKEQELCRQHALFCAMWNW